MAAFWLKTITTERQLGVATDFAVSGSSSSQMLFKIGVLKNFANFTGKHLCRSL